MYEQIFRPKKIGGLSSKNSVKYAACSVSNFNTLDGFVTDRELARMKVVADTGAGIITNQGVYPDPKGEGKAYYRQLSLNDDKYIPGMRKVADLIHENGAIALQQILHGGRYGGINLDYCIQPSAVPQTLRHFRTPREMTKEEIKQNIGDHARTAERAIEAGFDGIEITSFMGYLLSNFNSRFTNKRTDEYGGSLENRARFMCELIGEIKDTIGKESPLAVRLNGVELMDEFGGNNPEECIEFMKLAEGAGVDCISIVVGWHESRTGALGRDLPSDHWLFLAENAKKAGLKMPIAFGPKFGSPDLAEKALAEGKFDFWELCRPLLADPDLLQKIKEGRKAEIRPCMGGLMCLARMFSNLPYICTVNPRLGHEVEPEYSINPASVKKRVMVVGGGPAGMECALTATKRGHEVSLYEKETRLGGQLWAASKELAGGTAFLDLLKYYEFMLKKLEVDVFLNTEVTRAVCAKVRPNVVILATGSYVLPRPGLKPDGRRIITVFDLLEDKISEVGDKVVVIGGSRSGLVASEHLASTGIAQEVVIVEEGRRVAHDVISTFRWRHKAWLQEFGIDTFENARVIQINSDSVIIESDGQEKSLAADTVVIAGPRKQNQELFSALEFMCDELYLVGDATRPGSLHNAIHDAYKISVRI